MVPAETTTTEPQTRLMAGKRKSDHRTKNTKVATQKNMSLSSEEEEETKETEIKTMFSNILTELKTLKEQNETFRNETKKDIEELKAEIKGIDKNMMERCGSLETKINYVENNTNEKITQMEREITRIQEAEERRQRREKRNNIVVKSKEIDKASPPELVEKVKAIIQKTENNIEISNAIYIGKNSMDMGLIRVELRCLEDKIAIMKNKNKLQGTDIYIDDDLTKQEREIQRTLRMRAREEREKGNEARVGYQKLMINNNWVNWKELTPRQAP